MKFNLIIHSPVVFFYAFFAEFMQTSFHVNRLLENLETYIASEGFFNYPINFFKVKIYFFHIFYFSWFAANFIK